MQPGRPPIPQEETCPVPENLLGQLYRANSHGLDSLIATVPARTDSPGERHEPKLRPEVGCGKNLKTRVVECCFQETPRGKRSPKNLQELRCVQEKVDRKSRCLPHGKDAVQTGVQH